MSRMRLATLLLLLTLHSCLSSNIYLDYEDGRYKNVLVTIGSDVKEDPELLVKIMNSFTLASAKLLHATPNVEAQKKAFAFGAVSILIPRTWTDKFINSNVTWEKEGETDFHVVKGEKRPETLQLFGCGEKGHQAVIGDSDILRMDIDFMGNELVTQFSRLRWGVFNEHNNKGPNFYVRDNQISPVRCSEAIEGVGFDRTTGGSCKRNHGNLPDNNCIFQPNDVQTKAKGSLMFNATLRDVTQFCRDDTEDVEIKHNSLAPNPHNLHCRGVSVSTVIARHPDFVDGPKLESVESQVEFKIVKRPEERIVLVLDTSGSMRGLRLDNLKKVASHLIRNIPSSVSVGMVEFNIRANVLANMTNLDSDDARNEFIRHIQPLRSGGSSGTGFGLLEALELLEVSEASPEDVAYIYLLTDDLPVPHPEFEEAAATLANTSITLDLVSFDDIGKFDPNLIEISTGKLLAIYGILEETELQNRADELLKNRFISDSTTASKTELVAAVNRTTEFFNLTADDIIVVSAYFTQDGHFVKKLKQNLTGDVLMDWIIPMPGEIVINLCDDGFGADLEAQDGIYTAYIPTKNLSTAGEHVYAIKVTGSDETAYSNNFQINVTQDAAKLSQPPARITTLSAEANTEDKTVALTWTAVGDQLDWGRAFSQTILLSLNSSNLIDPRVRMSSALPISPEVKPAGQQISVTLTASDINIFDATFFLAVISQNNDLLWSETSNLVAVTLSELLLPTVEPQTTSEGPPEVTETVEVTDEVTATTDGEVEETTTDPEATESPTSKQTTRRTTSTSRTSQTSTVTPTTGEEVTDVETEAPTPTDEEVTEETDELTTATSPPSSTSTTTTQSPTTPDPNALTTREKVLVGLTVGLGIIVLIFSIYFIYTCSCGKKNKVSPDMEMEEGYHARLV